MNINVKVDTYLSVKKGFRPSHGVRVCFLYEDQAPEIMQVDGLPSEKFAFEHGKKMVQEFLKEVPEAHVVEIC